MKTGSALTAGTLRGFTLLAGLTILPAFTVAATAQQFFAEQDAGGEIRVIDSAGAEVSVANGDPVGKRPGTCPSGSYYFNELDSDKAQLVLTDCATGEGTFSMQIGSN